jgi:hypothetical protein
MLTTTTTTTTGAARRNAPASVPADVRDLLAAYQLQLDSILTGSNPKLLKGADRAHSVILHHLPERALARAINPATVATTAPRGYVPALRELAERVGMLGRALAHNGCAFAGACAAACLASSGHGGLSVDVTACRGRRTLASIAEPETYARAVLYAIARDYRRAVDAGVPLAVRLRGTDETPWHVRRFAVTVADAVAIRRRYGLHVDHGDAVTMADALATARADGSAVLYDYSKAPVGGPLGLIAQRAAGWHVTASFAADRATACADAIAAAAAGFAVAVPIALPKGAPLPSRVLISAAGQTAALRVVDGDTSDHRFADGVGGVAIVLREKIARGADRSIADRFVLPAAPIVRLADGAVQWLTDR